MESFISLFFFKVNFFLKAYSKQKIWMWSSYSKWENNTWMKQKEWIIFDLQLISRPLYFKAGNSSNKIKELGPQKVTEGEKVKRDHYGFAHIPCNHCWIRSYFLHSAVYFFFQMSIIFQKCFAQIHSENIAYKYFENEESSLRPLRPFKCEYFKGPYMYYYVTTVTVLKELSIHYLHLLI